MNAVFLFLVLFFILGAWPMYLHVTVLALSFFILIVAAQRHCQGRQFYAHRIHLTTYARDTVLSDTLSILSYFTLAMHFVCSQVHMWSWCGAAAPTSIVPSSSAYKSTEHYHCYICLWHFWKVCLALETYRACPKIYSLTSLCWSVCLPGHTGTTCISCRHCISYLLHAYHAPEHTKQQLWALAEPYNCSSSCPLLSGSGRRHKQT